jgi:hypothetical protein
MSTIWALILLVLAIAMLVLVIIYVVNRYVALHKVYKLFAPESATLFLVLSIFISLATPILFFVLAKKSPVWTNRPADEAMDGIGDTWDWNS